MLHHAYRHHMIRPRVAACAPHGSCHRPSQTAPPVAGLHVALGIAALSARFCAVLLAKHIVARRAIERTNEGLLVCGNDIHRRVSRSVGWAFALRDGYEVCFGTTPQPCGAADGASVARGDGATGATEATDCDVARGGWGAHAARKTDAKATRR